MATNNRTEFKKAWNARVPKNAWAEAKQTEAQKNLNVPDGNYLARLTKCMYGKDKNGDPYFMFRFAIRSENEKYDGQTGSKSHFLKKPKKATNEDGSKAKTLTEKLGFLAQDFQRLDKDTKEFDEKDIDPALDAADELTKEKPWIKIAVKNSVDRKTGKPDGREPLVFINGLARDDEIPDDDDENEEESEETEDEESDEEEASDDDEAEVEEASEEDEEEPPEDYDSEETDDDEEAEEETPAPKPRTTTKPASKVKAGAKVQYNNGKYTVKSVADGKVVLAASNGKITRNIPVAKCKVLK